MTVSVAAAVAAPTVSVSFFQNLEAEAKAWVIKEYETVLKPMIVKEETAFKPLVQATEQDVMEYGIPILLNFFAQASSALAGTAKMSGAVPALISALGAAGKSIAVQDAQAGLQIVVNQIKKGAEAASAAIAG